MGWWRGRARCYQVKKRKKRGGQIFKRDRPLSTHRFSPDWKTIKAVSFHKFFSAHVGVLIFLVSCRFVKLKKKSLSRLKVIRKFHLNFGDLCLHKRSLLLGSTSGRSDQNGAAISILQVFPLNGVKCVSSNSGKITSSWLWGGRRHNISHINLHFDVKNSCF